METQNLNLTLWKIFLLKEKVYWERTKKMKEKLNIFWFLIATLLISIGHYAFAFMHILFESFLWLTNKERYIANLNKSYSQLNKKS